MEYFWWMYLATRLDAIGSMFGGMLMVGILLATALAIVSVGGEKTSTKFKALVGTLVVVGALGVALTPSKQDAMFIAAGVGVVEASKALAGSEMAKTSVSIVEQWLKNELADQQARAQKGNKR